MNNSNKTTYTAGTSFTTLLAVAFIILKLCKIINWSWIWVLAPLWIPLGIAVLFLVGYLIFVIIVSIKN